MSKENSNVISFFFFFFSVVSSNVGSLKTWKNQMEMLFNRSTALEFLKRKQKPKCKSDQKKTRKMAESKKGTENATCICYRKKRKENCFLWDYNNCCD